MAKPHFLKLSQLIKQNYYKIAIIALTKKINIDALVKVAKGVTKGQASEVLPPLVGPPAGANPGSDPAVVGTSGDRGVVPPMSD